MKYLYIVLISLVLISCSNVDTTQFDSGTDRGYKDLKVVFDDGTDYYIQDKNAGSSSVKIKLLDKLKPKSSTPATTTAVKTPVKDEASDDSLKYASAPGDANLLYPVQDISIKKEYSESSFKGLEFSIGEKTEIKSSAPGMVIFSGNKASLGNTIFVYHNNGFISIYSNLESLNYKKGDFIKTSKDSIGLASKSFKYELRQRTKKGVVAVNPTKYLKKR